jgi:Abortive infection alpha
MSENDFIPISDEQAKLGKEIVGAARDIGGYLADILDDLPKNLVGLLGDKVRAWRLEHMVKLLKKAKKLLDEQGVKEPISPNPKVTLPILNAAADENSEELQDLWARLLAAAMNPTRSKQVRIGFAEALRKLDPLDALVLKWMSLHGNIVDAATKNRAAEELGVTRDEVEVSLMNLQKVGFAFEMNPPVTALTAFGREFLRTLGIGVSGSLAR